MAGRVRDEVNLRGLGRLEVLPGSTAYSRYRLLRVESADRPSQQAAREVAGIEWARPIYRVDGVDSPMLSTGQLVVRLRPDLAQREIDELFSDYGVAVVQPFDGLEDTYLLRTEGDPDENEVAAAAALYLDDRVTYAHPDFVALSVPRQATPQDEYYSRQWHLQNTGQNGATVGADIDVLGAWETTLGADVRIGMIDDCCDVEHEDLRGNYLAVGQDIDDGDDDPRPGEIGNRHGTSVMGLICGAANSEGIRGVAPNARFTVTRGLGFNTFAETASAYTFARQQGVDVHNNSWGYGPGFPVPDVVADAVRTAFLEGRGGKGMVILFASGNDGREAADDISGLPTVIAVGASNAQDIRTSYSNYGPHLDVVAPSNFGSEAPSGLPSLVTTDNSDDAGYAEPGYNNGGLNDFGGPNLANPDYTDDFGGTSGACPIAAGVAALVLSENPDLTATQVRLVLEHTAERIAASDAEYDGVTSHSDLYGYGRVNASQAVAAATQSKTNGGLTWPDKASNVRVTGSTLRWDNGAETKTTLVVQSNERYQWVPEDGETYEVNQEVATGITVAFKDPEGGEEFEFSPPDFGLLYFGIYSQNNVGRYSWGVLVDSNGIVTDAGAIDTGDTGSGDDDEVAELPINENPKVSLAVTPKSGMAPLLVTFQGNALTDSPIASAVWDFGDGSTPVEARETTHTYEALEGRASRYVATFTVTDQEGDVGQRSVAVDVQPSDTGGGDGSSGGSSGAVEILVRSAAAGNAEVSSGFAPLQVILELDSSGLTGVFNNVLWDLGDGTQADTVTVLHTYSTPGRYPIQATVTTCHATLGCRSEFNPSGITYTTSAPLKWIEVFESTLPVNEGDAGTDGVSEGSGNSGPLPSGGNAGGLCGMGVLPVWLGTLLLVGLRKGVRG